MNRIGTAKINKFRRIVWAYYRKNRRDFLWRRTRDPYKILVSEFMLQQTQTSRVEKKYADFLKKFPDVETLSRAPLQSVLRAWSGLGYNRRALYLKETAGIVQKIYGGRVPRDPDVLITLPGIGRGTAGAILAFAYNRPIPFIETNIRRAYIHFFFPKQKLISDENLLLLVEKSIATENPREWYYALMDYGAHLGRTVDNPNKRSAHYTKQSAFSGSQREIRGKIIKLIVSRPHTMSEIFGKITRSKPEIISALESLRKDELTLYKNNRVFAS